MRGQTAGDHSADSMRWMVGTWGLEPQTSTVSNQLSQRGPPAQSRYFKCGHDSRRLNFGFRQTKIVKSLSSGKAYCERTWAAGRITLNNLPNSALRNPIATTTAVGRLSGPQKPY